MNNTGTLLFLFLGCISLISDAQTRIDTVKAPNGKIKQIIEFKGYDNRNMYSITEYKGENRQIRTYIGYDESGKVRLKYTQKLIDFNNNGHLVYKNDGLYERFENGQCLESTNYKDGKRHGTFTYFYKNGQIEQSGTHKNDKLIGKYFRYYENGQLQSESFKEEIQNWDTSYRIVPSGWERSYTEEGTLKHSKFYNNGKDIYSRNRTGSPGNYLRHSPVGFTMDLEFYDNGSPSAFSFSTYGHGFTEYFLINGESTHLKYHWNEKTYTSHELQIGLNGEVLREKKGYNSYTVLPENSPHRLWLTNLKHNDFLNAGYTSGPVKIHYKNGNTKMDFTLKDGLIDGDFMYYSPDGQLIFKGEYSNGISEGEAYSLNLKGDTLMYQTFENGKVKFSNTLEKGYRYHKWYDDLGDVVKSIHFFENKKPSSYSDKSKGIYKTYWDTGILKSETGPDAEDSLLICTKTYYDNGKPERISYNQKGKYGTIGEYLLYYKNGQLKIRQFSDEHGLQGEAVTYNAQGDIYTKGNYVNGKKEGSWIITEDGIQKEVVYKSDVIQIENNSDICHCVDTSYSIKRHFPSRLVNLLDYNTYKKMHIDLFEPFSKEDYELIYMKRFYSSRLDLLFIKPIHLNLKGKGQSKLMLNPCFVRGYPTVTHAYYKPYHKNPDFRELDLQNMTLTLEMDVSRLKSTLKQENISFTFKINTLTFHEKNGIKMNPYKSEFCFNPIRLGPLHLSKAKGQFLERLETGKLKPNIQSQMFNDHLWQIPQTIDFGVMGAVLEDCNGYLSLDDKTIDIVNSRIHITESYISGQFSLPLQAINTDEEGIEGLKDTLIREGFTDVKLKTDTSGKLLNITFIITE